MGGQAPGEFAGPFRAPVAEITRLLERYRHDGTPLPMLPGHLADNRLAAGWRPDDPLLTVGLGTLARQGGISQFTPYWLSELRAPIEAAVTAVGIQEMFARDGTLTERADGQGQLPWAAPCTVSRPSRWSASSAPPLQPWSPRSRECGPAS